MRQWRIVGGERGQRGTLQHRLTPVLLLRDTRTVPRAAAHRHAPNLRWDKFFSRHQQRCMNEKLQETEFSSFSVKVKKYVLTIQMSVFGFLFFTITL